MWDDDCGWTRTSYRRAMASIDWDDAADAAYDDYTGKPLDIDSYEIQDCEGEWDAICALVKERIEDREDDWDRNKEAITKEYVAGSMGL